MHKIDILLSQSTKDSVYSKEQGICKICHQKCDAYYFDIVTYHKLEKQEIPEIGHMFIAHTKCVEEEPLREKRPINITRIISVLFFVSGLLVVGYAFFTFLFKMINNMAPITSLPDITKYKMDLALLVLGAILMSIGKLMHKSSDIERPKTMIERRVAERFKRWQTQRMYFGTTVKLFGGVMATMIILLLIFIAAIIFLSIMQ